MRYNNIVEAIGHTPLVRLNKITRGFKGEFYAKCDYLNPGGSVKDRIGIAMIEDAERRGLLKPGGTIVEPTSGNTGMGLALVAVIKGYKCIFTLADKQSKEKRDLLKALGAEVIVCPTAVEHDDPRSYTAVAAKLAREIPNAYQPNQYENPKNPEIHFKTTGPEIWEDSEGRITHFVCGIGTGGTITGVGRYLKSRNPEVKIIGADPVGSVLAELFHTGRLIEGEPYKVEGIGQDYLPSTLDFSVIDDIIQVCDKDSFLWTRRLARGEAIFAGGSVGTALAAAMAIGPTLRENDFLVVLIPDTGARYLSKVYNNEWMKENRYLESGMPLIAGEIVQAKTAANAGRALIAVAPSDTVSSALEAMQSNDFSQLPVLEDGRPVGAIYEDAILNLALEGKELKKVVVRETMSESFPVVGAAAAVDQIMSCITRDCPAVFVDLGNGQYEILTKYDLLHSIARRMDQGS
ncbi:MAG TPA: pyridoxal-phosphate dependent enzyme [Terriglobia bacterium]